MKRAVGTEEEEKRKSKHKGAGSKSFISKYGKGLTPQYQKGCRGPFSDPMGGCVETGRDRDRVKALDLS